MEFTSDHKLVRQHQIGDQESKIIVRDKLTEAAKVTAIKAFFFKNLNKANFILPVNDPSTPAVPFNKSLISSFVLPAMLAAFATKQGGSSPIAVPRPQRKASMLTA